MTIEKKDPVTGYFKPKIVGVGGGGWGVRDGKPLSVSVRDRVYRG